MALNFPPLSRAPSAVNWRLVGNTQDATSPFDGSVQTIAMPGARWKGTLTWASLRESDHRLLSAFVAFLGGRAGRFYYHPPHAFRRNVSPGPIKAGSTPNGNTVLPVTGATPGAVIFNWGDWFSYNDPAGRPRLHQVLGDFVADGQGAANVNVAPPIRVAPAVGATIEWYTPVGLFMLAADDTGEFGYQGDKPGRAAVSLDIVEALV